VELVDTEAVFADGSPQGVPGRELFYEHVHMKPQGNYLIARALFPRVVAMLPDEMRESAAAAKAPSQAEADRLLALTPFDRSRVVREVSGWLSRPPFTNQLNHSEQVRELQREAERGSNDREQTVAAYRWAIGKAPGDRWLHFNYGLFLEGRDPAAAAAEFRTALEILPGNYAARQKLADALIRMGKLAVC
jgi:tetratricopeptide (TPR) repeat protein